MRLKYSALSVCCAPTRLVDSAPRYDWNSAEHRIEDRQARNAELAALGLQPLGERRIQHGVEHDAGRGFDLGDHAIELLFGAHQRIDVLDRRDGRILRGGRARDRDQRLAGRVRHKMQMKKAAARVEA